MSARSVSPNTITPEIAARRAVRVAKGISVFEDASKKIYLVFSTSVFPVDWLATAYNLDGRRYDFGWGEDARTVFMFPYAVKERILSSLTVFKTADAPRAHIRGQVDAPKPVERVMGSIYAPLVPA